LQGGHPAGKPEIVGEFESDQGKVSKNGNNPGEMCCGMLQRVMWRTQNERQKR